MAGTDVFGRNVELGTPLAADSIRLLIPDIGNEDMLVQQLSLNYQQNINRLWEVGSPKTYFIAGRTEGNMSIKRVIGTSGIANAFIAKYADVCNIAGNHMTLSMTAGCGTTAGTDQGSITVSGCVLVSIAYSVQAQDMIINEDLGLRFAKMEKA